jgi:hypothetical protein
MHWRKWMFGLVAMSCLMNVGCCRMWERWCSHPQYQPAPSCPPTYCPPPGAPQCCPPTSAYSAPPSGYAAPVPPAPGGSTWQRCP